MDNAILVALITAGVSLVGTIITVLAANRSTIAAMDKKSDVNDTRIQGQIDVIHQEIKTLSDRVEKHNSIIERTYHLEERMTLQEEKVKVANHRIEDLERRENK